MSDEQKSELIEAKEARKILKSVLKENTLAKELADFGTRQANTEELVFSEYDLDRFKLIKPPYDPTKLMSIVESGGKLNTCIDIYVSSIEGYGYEFRYQGDKQSEDSPEVVQELEALEGFFKQVNESQSFTQLRKDLRRDYETTGNAYIEVVRYNNGDIAALYRVDPKYIRLQAKQPEPVEIIVNLKRNGKNRPTKLSKRFRRFAMVTNSVTAEKITWFKEYGDSRKMDAKTAKYEDELGKDERIKIEANEILHIKQTPDTYGVPRWSGIAACILGLAKADSVNYNLFTSNAIPALAILVSSGRLTAESVNDVVEILKGMKGEDSWNKIAILEAIGSDGGTIDDTNSTARVDFKELPRPDDALFQNFIRESEKRVMAVFRLPPLLSGETSDYSRATSSNAKLLTEDAVFSVERREFDEMFNFTIIKELGADYHKLFTIGPRLLEGSDLIDSIGKLARAGALSIDNSIKLSNRILDLDTPGYDQPWSTIPVAILLELIKKQQVTSIEGVGGEDASQIKEASAKIEEIKAHPEFDAISDDLEEIKTELDELYSLVARTE